MMIKRLYIHSSIYDTFLEKFTAVVKSFPVGAGTEKDAFIGPIQNGTQYGKAKDLFSSLRSENLTVILGGTITDSAGFFIPPTLIDNPPENSRVVREEPFAPILPLLKWDDEEDVIRRANDSESALGASVWTSDLKRGQRIADRLEAGNVWVNTHFEVSPLAPFGGHKSSGIGTEWGVQGLISYCNSQTVYVREP